MADRAVVLCGAAVAFIGSSCGWNHDLGRFQGSLARGIENKCGTQTNCKVRLGDYTDFRWDELYFFPYTTSKARITQVLGLPVKNWQEFEAYEVFLMRGKIMHQEEFGVDVEKPLNREVGFVIPTGSDFVRFTPEEKLTAKKEDTGSRVYFTVANGNR